MLSWRNEFHSTWFLLLPLHGNYLKICISQRFAFMWKTSPPIGCVGLASTVGVYLWSMCVCSFVRMYTLGEVCASQVAFARVLASLRVGCRNRGKLTGGANQYYCCIALRWMIWTEFCQSGRGKHDQAGFSRGCRLCACNIAIRFHLGCKATDLTKQILQWTRHMITIWCRLYTRAGQWRQFASSGQFRVRILVWIFPKSCSIPDLQ